MYKRFHVFAIHVSVKVVEQDDITIHPQRNGRISCNNFTVRIENNNN